MRIFWIFTILLVFIEYSVAYRRFRFLNTRMSSTKDHNLSSIPEKVISCETTGSCRSTRMEFKNELNAYRERNNATGVGRPKDYLETLASQKNSIKKSYSPFKKVSRSS